MYKLSFKTSKGIMTRVYNKNPIDYSDGGEIYQRETPEDDWVIAMPPPLYKARQDCYEKFGKDKFLNRHKLTTKEKDEIETYYHAQTKLYKEEEKTNEK